MQTDRLYSIGCAILVAACVLATVPVLEMGVIDDWRFAYSARELARCGHLAYVARQDPMLGVQAIWAAGLIRLFGFSFTLLRLSTLPFAAGCALLMYRLGRCAGLNRPFALFGTLSVTLSPLFIPLAASFMTDIPATFFWLACVYCAMRALGAANALQAGGWLAAAAAAGVAGGTVRQVVWVVPLLALPAAAWIRRGERRVAITALLLWCASGIGAALCLGWFVRQPHAARDLLLHRLPWRAAAVYALWVGLAGLLFILPTLVIHLADWRKRLRAPLSLAAGLLLPAAGLAVLHWRLKKELLLGDIVTQNGILWPQTMEIGVKPEILPAPVRGVLAALVVVGAGFTAAALFEGWRWPRWTSLASAFRPAAPDAESSFWLMRLSAPACFVYTLAILYRGPFDRYLIPLLPFLVSPLLWRYQRRVRSAPPALGWMVAGGFALYGIATTHDFLAARRASLEAASAMTAAGIPRTSITAGLEYDGWTELEHSGDVGAFGQTDAGPFLPGRQYPEATPGWVWDGMPSIDPVYFVTYSRLPGLRDAPFPTIRYHAWLPPFERQVLTQFAPLPAR